MSAQRVPILAALACLLACVDPLRASAPVAATAQPTARALKSQLYVSPKGGVLPERPDLVERIRRSPFAYYRFINREFTGQTCAGLTDAAAAITVNLHGDAHVEQYAVAADGEGLADFDAAALGPPSVDFERFATSIVLAASNPDDARVAVAAFLEGYKTGLAEPDGVVAETGIARRIRAQFAPSPNDWLSGVETLMHPVPAEKRQGMERARARYISAMLSQNPDLGASFFQMKKFGLLQVGLGSALEAKFLARVEGPSAAPEDDVILETKQVATPAAQTCVKPGMGYAQRVALGQARLSTTPQRFLGYVELEDNLYYVHAWRLHYREVDAAELSSKGDWAELGFVVGMQLGRGHPRHFEQIAHLRHDLRGYVDTVSPTLFDTAVQRAALVVKAWEEFSADAGTSGVDNPRSALR